MNTKTKPYLHAKRGDKIVFTSEVSGDKRVDTAVKVDYDGGQTIKITFPAVKVTLSDGKKVEVTPKSTLTFDVNKQMEYVV